MDNECADNLKTALNKDNVEYQLVPPYIHYTNNMERAIQTFNNHFKTSVASIDPGFPVREGDRLISLEELTLKLMRTSKKIPKLSAWADLFGQFD